MYDVFFSLLDRICMRVQGLSNSSRRWHIPPSVLGKLAFEVSQDFSPKEPYERTEVDKAIERAQRYFLGIQKPDGHWVGELEADSTLTSDYILVMHFLGKVDAVKQKKAAKYIVDKQLPDGGWNIYANGPSEISASVKAYFALKLAGVSPSEPFMQKAKECILNLGGITRCNAFTKIYLAIFGQMDWKVAPAVPVEMMLFPSFFWFNIYEMSYWSRCIVVPLTIVSALRHRLKLKLPESANLDELYLIPRHKADLGIRRDQPGLTWKNFFIDVDGAFKRYEHHRIDFIREYALKKAEQWMIARLDKSGGLGAIWPGIINSIFAMKALGYPDDHFQMKRAIRETELLVIDEGDSLHLQPCVSPVWDTAWAVIALHDAGLSKSHPAMVKACRWLIEKEIREPGDWCIKNPGVEPTGWYFEYANEFYPDTDDSAAVLMALQRVSLQGEKEEVVRRATQWLMSMQCDDGGWGAFDRNNNKAVLNYIPFADFGALLDPSTSDVTGRCLDWLGRLGIDASQKIVQKAMMFLKKEQEKDGSWFGRWGSNYIYGTWSVLCGLTSMGEDVRQDYIRKAARWLKSVQLPDGGWGERCDSYEDPRLKAKGPSTPAHTAWAVMALILAGEVDSQEVGKGIEYLIRTQKPDGSWDENEFTATGFPRFFYLEYHLYRNYFPLMALGRYRQKKAAPQRVAIPLPRKEFARIELKDNKGT